MHSKGNPKRKKKTTLNIRGKMQPNLKATYSSQKHANSSCSSISNTINPREKIDQRSKWMYLQRRHRDGHKAYEKMLSISVREMPIKLQQGISSPQNDHPPTDLQRFNASEGEKGTGRPPTLWVGMEMGGCSHKKNIREIPENIKYSCHLG